MDFFREATQAANLTKADRKLSQNFDGGILDPSSFEIQCLRERERERSDGAFLSLNQIRTTNTGHTESVCHR